MKILVPTDFSAAADRALAQAMVIREQVGGSVTACHVMEPSGAMSTGYIASRTSFHNVPTGQEFDFDSKIRSLERGQQAGVSQQLLQRLATTAPQADRHDLLHGGVAEQISLAAADDDLVVMSSGDTARQLLWQLPCPLLSVPHDVGPRRLLRLAVLIDFSTASRAALEWCSGLESHGVELLLVHVGSEGKRAESGGRLEEIAGGRPTFVASGRVDRAAAEIARRFEMDAVAIGGKRRSAPIESLLRGTAGRLFKISRVPVFVVQG